MPDGQTLWIARHGQRIDFEDEGWLRAAERPHDPPLAETGVQQATELGRRLAGEGIAAVFASPFLRTVQTAHHVAEAVDRPIFIERGFCEWLNHSWYPEMPDLLGPAEMARRFPRVDARYRSCVNPTYPEIWEEMEARSALAATLITSRYPHDLLIVGHGATVMGICNGLLSEPPDKVSAPCCAITKMVRDGDEWRLALQADRSHLSEPRGDDRLA